MLLKQLRATVVTLILWLPLQDETTKCKRDIQKCLLFLKLFITDILNLKVQAKLLLLRYFVFLHILLVSYFHFSRSLEQLQTCTTTISASTSEFSVYKKSIVAFQTVLYLN